MFAFTQDQPVTTKCSPQVFAHTLDPVAQITDVVIPILEPYTYALDLTLLEHLWLDPVDLRHLGDLIDRSCLSADLG